MGKRFSNLEPFDEVMGNRIWRVFFTPRGEGSGGDRSGDDGSGVGRGDRFGDSDW